MIVKHNYEFGEGEFQNLYLGKQYFKFGEVKFLKLKEVSINILGEAIFWFGEGKLHNFTHISFKKHAWGSNILSLVKESFTNSNKFNLAYFEFGEGKLLKLK